MDLPPPKIPVEKSAFYIAFLTFKDAFTKSRHEHWDEKVREALERCAPYMPKDERA